jgi:hypothetical protein
LLWIVPVLLIAGAGALLGARWALTADRFAVRRVETGPYRFSEPGELERRLSAALGCNIWTREGERRLRAELAALPWVRRVEIERELPGTLSVRLEEWRPLFAVQPDSQSTARLGARPTTLVLCGDGRVVPFPAHLPAPDLPLLTGAALAPGDAGPNPAQWRLAGRVAAEVLALGDAVAETGLEAVAPIDFVVSGRDGLTVILQDARGRLRLGEDGYAGSLRRYLAVRGELAAGATVDLRFGRRVFVGVGEPADDAPADAESDSPKHLERTGPPRAAAERAGKLTGGRAGVAGRRSDARA